MLESKADTAIGENPSEIIAHAKMGQFQIVAIGLCVLLNAVDGFDVLSISFASPGIAADWGIDRAALGIVLSMELIGMAIGSVLIGGMADRFGRRPIILGCIIIMALGMLAAGFSTDVYNLSASRLFTGLGIGGMLASTNAMVAEYSNNKNRHLAVTLMAAGFPVGAVVGGSIASYFLVHFGWHSVFFLGAVFTIALFPLVWLLMPESIAYLNKARPDGAVERINRTLKRMGHRTISALAAPEIGESSGGWASLFSRRWVMITLLLTIAYFAHIMTFYYILKWIPKIVVDMGYAPSLAASVLVWANVGGAAGAITLGILTRFLNTKHLVLVALLASVALITIFGIGYETLFELSVIAALTGFCTNSGVTGLYALMASILPTELRASGTGFVIGMGRGGAALGPILAGVLFASGASLLVVSIVMALGSAVAFLALFGLPYREAKKAA
jgi:benzoate transport